jgi:hypothetical protein
MASLILRMPITLMLRRSIGMHTSLYVVYECFLCGPVMDIYVVNKLLSMSTYLPASVDELHFQISQSKCK